ncbi:sensor histidine kinase [Flammeovirga kamogawensis]|uniref:histidine kinase n=1 Tax=Flammeovirga kamogawensis TaxID=373891 RepID=A0ABX8GTA5_9BACT|nr:ATP-binding protein [Flammeovirga kamogawensis]MBB6462439.1 signal transduction histidine kinase/FixJ family two-component response regulator [Flammeovirga kamogawensis]QWG06823.1 response regulator [Flammeovirga kamogawensis]TRX68646.1 response regulator [Flammeovirga kamogawensis]
MPFSNKLDQPHMVVRVLLIDDDEDDYIITEDILDDIPYRNYELDWVSNFDDAISIINHGVHDVYIVDYLLGAKSGLDLIIEALKDSKHKPFILLTGQGDVRVDEKAMTVGASDYLVKGQMTPQQLERAIRHSILHSRHLNHISELNEKLEQRVQDRTRQLDKAIKTLQRSNEDLELQINERKKAEEELLKSQAIYKIIAHNFPYGIIAVLDENLKYMFADGTGFKELELDARKIIGAQFFQFLRKNDPSKAKEYDARFELAKSVIVSGEEQIFDFDFKDLNYSVIVVPIKNSRKQTKQVLVVMLNITQQRKAESEIRKSLQKERELSELKSRFVSMASHEFRTPLSTIMSSVSLISRYTSEEYHEKRNKHIKRIKSSVNNLTQILNDFLSISKLEEGKSLVHKSTLKVDDFIEGLCDEMSPVKKQGQKIIIKHTGDTLIKTDAQILKNIIINLLSNAIKYSGHGSRIWVDSCIDEDNLQIRIKDEGMGIPEKDQVHLFDRFFRAENAMNIQGTGLGLNIVNKYLEMLNGKISFESIEDKGTTFSITIPKKIILNEKDTTHRG